MQKADMQQRLSAILTDWSLVKEAHEGAPGPASPARQELLLRYWEAAYRYLLAAVHDPDVAWELLQQFALKFVRGDFRGAKRERGQFRDYLKTALWNAVRDHRERKRLSPLPEDSSQQPAADTAAVDLDQAFLEQWRAQLLDQTWTEFEKTGGRYYSVLRWYADHPDASAAELADDLCRQTGEAFSQERARQLLHRGRAQFASLLLDEVAHSLEISPTDPSGNDRLQQELADLALLEYCRPALDKRIEGRS